MLDANYLIIIIVRFLKDEGLKPELLVTLKLAKPGEVSGNSNFFSLIYFLEFVIK